MEATVKRSSNRTPRMSLVEALLRSGKYTTRQMVKLLPVSDPKREIKRLRDIGCPVGDMWERNAEGDRYKVYFIHNTEVL